MVGMIIGMILIGAKYIIKLYAISTYIVTADISVCK